MLQAPSLTGFAQNRQAFTLLELLAVVAVIGIAVAMVVPALQGILGATDLSRSTQTLVSQLSLARQTAVARDCPVEVRLYRVKDSAQSGAISSGRFRAMQLFTLQESGSAVPLGKVQSFATSVIIDSGQTLSSLVHSFEQKSGTELAYKIPSFDLNYECTAFRFLPDGSTDLSKADCWFLTLRNNIGPDPAPSAPRNFSCVQIDPVNGHLRTFQP